MGYPTKKDWKLIEKQIQGEILRGKHDWAVKPCEHRLVGKFPWTRVGTHKVPDEVYQKMVLHRAMYH